MIWMLCRVVGDQKRVLQLLLKLLNNGVKFTNHGKVTLRVDTLSTSNNNNEIERIVKFHIDIEDTGVGIKDEFVGKLFQKFSQFDGSRNRFRHFFSQHF